MSDDTGVTSNATPVDITLQASGYNPPSSGGTNQDSGAIQAMIAQAVQNALAQQAAVNEAASRPKVLTPEEEARVALDNAGAVLGVDERLRELYKIVDLLAQKAGI